MHVRILVLMVVERGLGFCVWDVACAPLSSFFCVFSGVDDDVDDACMDGSNSLIQGFGCHATACACLDALQKSRRVRGHCLRGGTKCSSTGSGAQVWLSDGIKGFLISTEARKFACRDVGWCTRKSPSEGFPGPGAWS